jgi:adenine-specific DNA glycosylase
VRSRTVWVIRAYYGRGQYPFQPRPEGVLEDIDEHEMMEIVPKEDWSNFAHLMIDHGRAICMARKPLCLRCPVMDICPEGGVTRAKEKA